MCNVGGPFFDPMGFSRGDEDIFHEYKVKEVKNGRLAMLAILGFVAQYAATSESSLLHCIANIADECSALPTCHQFGFARMVLTIACLLVI